jgi:hypothetical protein
MRADMFVLLVVFGFAEDSSVVRLTPAQDFRARRKPVDNAKSAFIACLLLNDYMRPAPPLVA